MINKNKTLFIYIILGTLLISINPTILAHSNPPQTPKENSHKHSHNKNNPKHNTSKENSKKDQVERLSYNINKKQIDWNSSKLVLDLNNEQVKELIKIENEFSIKSSKSKKEVKSIFMNLLQSTSNKDFNKEKSIEILDLYLEKTKEDLLIKINYNYDIFKISNNKRTFEKFNKLLKKDFNYIKE